MSEPMQHDQTLASWPTDDSQMISKAELSELRRKANERDFLNERVTAGLEEIQRLQRKLQESQAACIKAEQQCEKAEEAIRACPALKEWGPSTQQYLASRVAFLCNYYDGAVHTITELDKALESERAARKSAESEVQRLREKP